MAKKAVTKKSTTKKKTAKAPSRKKTTKKSASSSAAPKPSAKRSPSKKKTTKRTTSKKPASKKSTPAKSASTRKKTSKAASSSGGSKKTASKSKSSTTKKPTAKKPAARKPSSKKPPARKPSSKKAPARKPSNKPSTAKASETKPAKTKSDSKSGGKSGSKDRWKGSFDNDISSSVDAASRLAAAAGLRPLHERQTTLAASVDYKKLTKTPLKKRELDRFKEILRLKRAQVTGDVTDMETEALIGRGSGSLSKLPQHMADAGSDTYDQTLNLDLAAGQRKLLKEIDDALARIENKTYGICEMLGKPISKERLENTPWARYSIEAARRMEMFGA